MLRQLITLVLLIFCLSATASATEEQSSALQGKVTETMSTSEYTYILLQTEESRQWVALPVTAVKVGQEITVAPGMILNNFHSPSFERDFKTIIFSSGLRSADQKTEQKDTDKNDKDFTKAVEEERARDKAAASSRELSASSQSPGSAGATVPFLEVTVPKAEGNNAITVGEAFEKADTLNGKTVRIRGKVVKYNPAIMGRNWIHLQDGTGDPMKNSHDLVVTSSEEATVGDTLLIEGTLTTHQDFGYGYSYEVLIDKARILP